MVLPALLTDNRAKFKEMLINCLKFTDHVQVDIMDGIFVPSKSITQEDLDSVDLKINSEAHLMVVDPLAWVESFVRFGSKRIIFHSEVEADKKQIISQIKNRNLEAGIALNPKTALEEIEDLIEDLDVVLFMSVNPGFYGAPFIPEVLDKIKEFKRRYPDKIAGIDGGVKFDNLNSILSSKVDYVCVGSAILKAQDQALAYQRFRSVVDGQDN
ncbi:MAG: ribulose-phosphate 3-epimerase [Candidatus Omnitrophica bacterium]|nr:ribulose-phosphate 3-epimerase [Candidatus Omnitrophota bacterium]